MIYFAVIAGSFSCALWQLLLVVHHWQNTSIIEWHYALATAFWLLQASVIVSFEHDIIVERSVAFTFVCALGLAGFWFPLRWVPKFMQRLAVSVK
ncbi:MAG: hypothetical protein WDZ93_02090 [Candidatus Paceibacterota bacterium]